MSNIINGKIIIAHELNVSAIQFTGKNIDDVIGFCDKCTLINDELKVVVTTILGNFRTTVYVNNWIVKEPHVGGRVMVITDEQFKRDFHKHQPIQKDNLSGMYKDPA